MKKIISVLIVVSFMVLLATPTLAASENKVDLSANLTFTFDTATKTETPSLLPDVNTVIENAVASADYAAVQGDKEAAKQPMFLVASVAIAFLAVFLYLAIQQ